MDFLLLVNLVQVHVQEFRPATATLGDNQHKDSIPDSARKSGPRVDDLAQSRIHPPTPIRPLCSCCAPAESGIGSFKTLLRPTLGIGVRANFLRVTDLCAFGTGIDPFRVRSWKS